LSSVVVLTQHNSVKYELLCVICRYTFDCFDRDCLKDITTMAWCKFIRCLSGCATQTKTPCKQINKKITGHAHNISIDFHVPTWLRPQVPMLKWHKQFNIFPTKYVYRYNYFFFIYTYLLYRFTTNTFDLDSTRDDLVPVVLYTGTHNTYE